MGGGANKWAAAERPAVAARKLFEEIHALWTEMQREGDQMSWSWVTGFWRYHRILIRHPVLLRASEFAVDPDGPSFASIPEQKKLSCTVRCCDSYRYRRAVWLRSSTRNLNRCRRSRSVVKVRPDSFGALYRACSPPMASSLTVEPSLRLAGPSIRRRPVIFLRTRSAGLATTLDHIVEDLEDNDAAPPEGLTRIVGVDTIRTTGRRTAPATAKGADATGPEPDILFSKPANAEQYEIATRLAKSKAVLVQGPPGTGKTHTIANLLGCLLAQGKTVLVTAHTTKALRVLPGQVDDALKPLCLERARNDAESHDQLSRAAQEIASRLSTSDAASLRRELVCSGRSEASSLVLKKR